MAKMSRRAALTAVLLLGMSADAGAATRVSVADPAGGARWTATQSVRADGRTCVSLKRGRAGKGTTCARLGGRTVYSYIVRNERTSRPRSDRTIFIVTLAPNVTRARLRAPGGTRTYRRRSGRPRVLLAVLAGRVERPTLSLDVRTGGRTVRLIEGPPPAVQVADPLDGPAWRSRGAAASGGGVCIAWERVPPRFAPTPEPARGTPRCGDPDADVPVAAAERVSGRLVIFGLAGAGVRSTVLRGPAGDQPLALESKTRALLAVLPGETDPASLRVIARMADGREVERPLDVVG
jgi:hypothetical protein